MARATQVALLPLLLASLAPAAARADGAPAPPTKEACVLAYDETQTLRQAGSLRAAREKALTCSQAACPSVVQKDCAQWLGELEATLPRVSFAVKDASGRDTTAARVFLDDRLLLERVEASAVPVDPGERVFRVELEGGASREERVIVREGERGRVIAFSFERAPDAVGPTTAPPAERQGGGLPLGSYVLGGVGLVGLGLFGTFGVLGLAEKSDAEDPDGGCAPRCTDDEVGSIETKFLVADVSLGVGVAALGAAVIVALVAGDDEGEAAASGGSLSAGLSPAPGGGFAALHGSF